MALTQNTISRAAGVQADPVGACFALLPYALAATVTCLVWMQAEALATDAKLVITVTIFAIVGWIATPVPDSLVALCAALSLVVTGAQPQDALTDTLSQDIVWLLLSAFVIAAVLKDAGLAEQLVAPLTRGAPRVLPFMLLTAAAISATAFLLPSTSGRAALLLPVCLGLLSALPDIRLTRPIALLFPTAILLSAGGSLIGAGAHVIAVEAIAATNGPRLGYLEWLMIGAPLAFASVGLATILIFVLFVPNDLRTARLIPAPHRGSLCHRQRRILLVLAALVALWLTKPLHGLDEPIVALGGAVLLLLPPFGARRPKDVFRAVDLELILYMAATLMLSVAVIDTGVDRWLAIGVLSLMPAAAAGHTGLMVLFLAVAAVVSHLAITSRSARAAILVPALALPVAGLGHDATLAILIAVMGTGFCQTLMVSAKPVAIFGLQDEAGFTQRDLFRLALPLAPLKVALLASLALWVWPHQLAQISSTNAISTAARQEAPIQSHHDTAGLAFSPRPVARPQRVNRVAAVSIKQVQALTRDQSPLVAQMRRDARQIGSDLNHAGRMLERQLSRIFR